MISSVNMLGSCVIVVSRAIITKPVMSISFSKVIRSGSTHPKRFQSNISTMRPQIFLTRSDFPAAGIDLLQHE